MNKATGQKISLQYCISEAVKKGEQINIVDVEKEYQECIKNIQRRNKYDCC